MFDIIAAGHEILRKPVEQVAVPRRGFHFINRLHQSASHETRPQSVHQRPAQASVLSASDKAGELFEAFGFARQGIDGSQLGIHEPECGVLSGGFVAPGHFQFFIGVNSRQSIGIGQRPVVDKTVMARCALQVHAHENLRDILRGLHLRHLAGIDRAAPDNPLGEALGFRFWIDEFRDEPVEGQVGGQRGIEPSGDLFAAAVDVACPAIIISQQIVPKRQPMLGITRVVRQKTPHQALMFVATSVAQKRIEFRRRGEQPDDIEVNPPGKNTVVHHRAIP